MSTLLSTDYVIGAAKRLAIVSYVLWLNIFMSIVIVSSFAQQQQQQQWPPSQQKQWTTLIDQWVLLPLLPLLLLLRRLSTSFISSFACKTSDCGARLYAKSYVCFVCIYTFFHMCPLALDAAAAAGIITIINILVVVVVVDWTLREKQSIRQKKRIDELVLLLVAIVVAVYCSNLLCDWLTEWDVWRREEKRDTTDKCTEKELLRCLIVCECKCERERKDGNRPFTAKQLITYSVWTSNISSSRFSSTRCRCSSSKLI